MEDLKKIFSTRQRKLVGAFVLLLLLVIIIPALGGKKSPSSGSSKTSQVAAPAPVDPAVLEADKKTLADLKTKFKYTYDEFEKKGWYEAKTQNVDNTWNKQVLKVYVNNVGYAYLSDQYYGESWIFHTRVEVKIGDTVYKSDDIPTYDSDNSTHNSGGSVWESLSYTGGRDNGIIKAIAESGDAAVLVRFTSDQGQKDFTLAKRDQEAIKDAYELSNLIIKVGDTGATK